MYGLRTEPAAVTLAIRMCLYALIAFQIIVWTDVQIVALLAAVDSVLTLFVRSNSTSQATLKEAGTSQALITALADVNVAAAKASAKPPSFTSRL
jgi:hypothetical protein